MLNVESGILGVMSDMAKISEITAEKLRGLAAGHEKAAFALRKTVEGILADQDRSESNLPR